MVGGPSFEETWIPLTQGCFVPSLVEIGPVVLEKKMKMWKVYRRMDGRTNRRTDRRTDRQTDDGWQVIRKAHLSFQLRWAKKGKRCVNILIMKICHINFNNISKTLINFQCKSNRKLFFKDVTSFFKSIRKSTSRDIYYKWLNLCNSTILPWKK